MQTESDLGFTIARTSIRAGRILFISLLSFLITAFQ